MRDRPASKRKERDSSVSEEKDKAETEALGKQKRARHEEKKRSGAEPSSGGKAAMPAPAPAPLPSSKLSFSDVRALKHVVLAYHVDEEPEVQLWNADVMAVHEDSQTLDVRIREWRLLVRNAKPNSIFKPSTSLAVV